MIKHRLQPDPEAVNLRICQGKPPGNGNPSHPPPCSCGSPSGPGAPASRCRPRTPCRVNRRTRGLPASKAKKVLFCVTPENEADPDAATCANTRFPLLKPLSSHNAGSPLTNSTQIPKTYFCVTQVSSGTKQKRYYPNRRPFLFSPTVLAGDFPQAPGPPAHSLGHLDKSYVLSLLWCVLLAVPAMVAFSVADPTASAAETASHTSSETTI